MSLNRFSNRDSIISTDGTLLTNTWSVNDVQLIAPIQSAINLNNFNDLVVELHAFAPSAGEISPEADVHVGGGPITDYRVNNNELLINYSDAMSNFGFTRGDFEVIVNMYRNLIGSYVNKPFIIKEISPDRREIMIETAPNANVFALDIQYYLDAYGGNDFRQIIYQTQTDVNGNTVLVYDQNGAPIIDLINSFTIAEDNAFINLGNNHLYRIINQKSWDQSNQMVLRLYQPLPAEFVEGVSTLSIVEQISDSYSDNIALRFIPPPESLNYLSGPDFSEYTYNTHTETDFQNYNQILDGATSVSQEIVDALFSGSLGGSKIPIDYSGFQNFVFYSSAEERVRNFKSKLEEIEFYDSVIETLNTAVGTDQTSLQNNITLNTNAKNEVIGNFDAYERWLYNEATASLFTDFPVYTRRDPYVAEGGMIGAENYRIQPWPKFISTGLYSLHHTTSSIATEWFENAIASASIFDTENNNALSKTVPEFIREDQNNDQYVKFVNMIGHHFDILYTYVNNLSIIQHQQEHPKLGQDKNVYQALARSMGWYLQNGNQATALSQYALGVDSVTGAYAQTGSLFSKSNEDLTSEVWQRMYNNLPYILKTKGTKRAIHAIMNIYGIPQSLLSIREYGGPKVGEDEPVLIEDRFAYALRFNSGSHLSFESEYVSSSFDTRVGPAGISRGEIPIIKREFRFRPEVTQSMQLYSRGGSDTGLLAQIGIEYTSSYSGSDRYGRIVYAVSAPDDAETYSGSTQFVPLYDGEFWNITEYYTTTGDHFNTGSNTDTTYHLDVQKSSDYIVGKVIHSASVSLTPDSDSHFRSWASSSNTLIQYLGTYPNEGANSLGVSNALQSIADATIASSYTGSIQEYREWLENFDQKTFDIHTLNPSSYVSSISPTGSYDTLLRHYPLGTDLLAIDRSQGTGLIVSSSHPAQDVLDFSPTFGVLGNTYASASGFFTPINEIRGNYEAVEETYYVQGVSLGGSVPRSQKIRLEENDLIHTLSPDRSAETSRYDRAPLDSNRLGLFYSLADQINKDIFNHVGDVALDDFVGDPDHEFTNNYPDLFHFSKHYWKKFEQRNDLNAFLRIFTQFDFSIFTQIRQTIPERVDEVMGLLVEPHALERSKVKITDLPTFEDLFKETEIAVTNSLFPTSDVITVHEATLDDPTAISGETIYHLNDNGVLDIGNRFGEINVYHNSASDYCTIDMYPVDEEPSATASISAIYTVKNDPVSSRWSKLFNISTEDSHVAELEVISTASFADSLRLQIDTYSPFETVRDFHLDIIHRKLSDPAITAFALDANVLTTTDNAEADHPDYYDGTRHIVSRSGDFVGRNIQEKTLIADHSASAFRKDRITFENVRVEPFTFLTFDLQYAVTGSYTQSLQIDKVSIIQDINKVCHNPIQQQVYDCRPSDIYMKKIYHFGSQQTTFETKYDLDRDRYLSQSAGLYYSQSLETACYMDDFFADIENLHFNGCKLTGPGVNLPSNDTAIGSTPIVEIYITNPNQMNYANLANANTAGGNIAVNIGGQPVRPVTQAPTPFSGINVPSRGVIANLGLSVGTNNNQGFGG